MNDLFLLLLAGHLIGDFVVQTDWQAQEKGWYSRSERPPALFWDVRDDLIRRLDWRQSVRANQLHCLTYHMTMAAVVLPFWRTWGTLAAFAVSWVTHAFIDRRWPVRMLLRTTGSPSFAEQPWGVIATDQALHLSILAMVAVLLS